MSEWIDGVVMMFNKNWRLGWEGNNVKLISKMRCKHLASSFVKRRMIAKLPRGDNTLRNWREAY